MKMEKSHPEKFKHIFLHLLSRDQKSIELNQKKHCMIACLWARIEISQLQTATISKIRAMHDLLQA